MIKLIERVNKETKSRQQHMIQCSNELREAEQIPHESLTDRNSFAKLITFFA